MAGSGGAADYRLAPEVRDAVRIVGDAAAGVGLCAAGLENALQGIDFKPLDKAVSADEVQWGVLDALCRIVAELKRAYDLLT